MSSDLRPLRPSAQMFMPMDFNGFLDWSRAVSRTVPNVKRLCETRIARAFERIRPKVDVPASFATVHRCDLARQWCQARGVPSGRAATTLICEGVRHGLRLIFETLARSRMRVAIPDDVYPVYWRIASETAVEAIGVATFPRFDLENIFRACDNSRTSVLFLPAPLKLHGRHWTESETEQAQAWLREDRHRRLILDGVYSFGLPMNALTRSLVETEQVIYLDSLSKGWLHELVLGVAIVPERDFGTYVDTFRDVRLPQEKLFFGRRLLSDFPGFPLQLSGEIDRRREALLNLVRGPGLRALPAEQGYLVAIESGVSKLLDEHRLLTVPATAFGSKSLQWSVASALPSEHP